MVYVMLQKGLTVHVDGCRQALMNHIRTSLFLGMCVVTSICFFLQTIILILYRYLQTSVALAIKKGDPTADSLAYLSSICLPRDDMTEDKCQTTVTTATAAPSAAPSFASSAMPVNPPQPSTSQTLEQAAATLAAVAQPQRPAMTGLTPVNPSQSLVYTDPAGENSCYTDSFRTTSSFIPFL